MKTLKLCAVTSLSSILINLVYLVFLSGVLLLSCRKDDNIDIPPPGGEEELFIKAVFRASHNSFSGNNDDGHRGSIRQQLDAGLRFVEFDIRYENNKFVLGHNYAGNGVYKSHGNPNSDNLKDWLHIVADWSRNNYGHSPVILALDMKNGISRTHFLDLNEMLSDSLSDHLLKAVNFSADKSVSDLAGRVLVVLSGDFDSRKTYSKFGNDTLICFVEFQKDDNTLQNELFYAAENSNSNCSWVGQGQSQDKIVRLWDVSKSENCSNPLPNLPATNSPYFGWYARYCDNHHVIPDFDFLNVEWSDEKNHDTGWGGDCAVNDSGLVVEVHCSETHTDHLWYNTGKIQVESINWFNVDNDLRHYTGVAENPSVAINDYYLMIEVHGSTMSNKLFYRTGKVKKNTGEVLWLAEEEYDQGENPSVAINNDSMVVEVHEAAFSDKLYYNVGKIMHNGTISWGNMGQYRNYETGNSPSVALYGNQIVEVHNSSTDYIWCIIGNLNVQGKKIDWKDSQGYDTFSYPCEEDGSIHAEVAMNAFSSAEVHQSTHGLWWRPGKLSNTIMALGKSNQIGSTHTGPSLAMNSKALFVFYNDADYHLNYRIGKIK
ncbi:MAG: hypothetical protein PHD61_07330 [Bacteroidales bacterium]|nr:hypothetical protein [Lentimicrobiaceae bacterium]MDD5695101.1 hypothetical protein [Bacteroidales bacterium]